MSEMAQRYSHIPMKAVKREQNLKGFIFQNKNCFVLFSPHFVYDSLRPSQSLHSKNIFFYQASYP